MRSAFEPFCAKIGLFAPPFAPPALLRLLSKGVPKAVLRCQAAMAHDELTSPATLAKLIPPLLESNYKGQCGKVAVVGGCREYTGAPYFAAMTALRVGSDLAHVFCTDGAATVIKSYSPELIVHPYLVDSDGAEAGGSGAVAKSIELVSQWVDRFNCIVVGPGLGRDPVTLQIVRDTVHRAKAAGIPLVFDADGLWLVNKEPGLIQGYGRAVLTPNPVEFKRLADALGMSDTAQGSGALVAQAAQEMSRLLAGPIILQKGSQDVITDRAVTMLCGEEGSNRRCGGQGDVLSGTIAAFCAWAHLAELGKGPSKGVKDVLPANPLILGCYAASLTVRTASRRAFARRGRAMLATDVIDEVGAAFADLFEGKEGAGGGGQGGGESGE